MNPTPHTNFVLEHFEMSLISYQTTSRPHEEMEVAATDTLKCHIGRVRLKVRALSTDRSLGPRRSLPPHCLSCLCSCHSLIQLSCNNNKSEVYRLFRVEGKEGGEWKERGSRTLFHLTLLGPTEISSLFLKSGGSVKINYNAHE